VRPFSRARRRCDDPPAPSPSEHGDGPAFEHRKTPCKFVSRTSDHYALHAARKVTATSRAEVPDECIHLGVDGRLDTGRPPSHRISDFPGSIWDFPGSAQRGRGRPEPWPNPNAATFRQSTIASPDTEGWCLKEPQKISASPRKVLSFGRQHSRSGELIRCSSSSAASTRGCIRD
jgi:hypothetical protein